MSKSDGEWTVRRLNAVDQKWVEESVKCGPESFIDAKSSENLIRYSEIQALLIGKVSKSLQNCQACTQKSDDFYFSIVTNNGTALDFEVQHPRDRDAIVSAVGTASNKRMMTCAPSQIDLGSFMIRQLTQPCSENDAAEKSEANCHPEASPSELIVTGQDEQRKNSTKLSMDDKMEELRKLVCQHTILNSVGNMETENTSLALTEQNSEHTTKQGKEILGKMKEEFSHALNGQGEDSEQTMGAPEQVISALPNDQQLSAPHIGDPVQNGMIHVLLDPKLDNEQAAIQNERAKDLQEVTDMSYMTQHQSGDQSQSQVAQQPQCVDREQMMMHQVQTRESNQSNGIMQVQHQQIPYSALTGHMNPLIPAESYPNQPISHGMVQRVQQKENLIIPTRVYQQYLQQLPSVNNAHQQNHHMLAKTNVQHRQNQHEISKQDRPVRSIAQSNQWNKHRNVPPAMNSHGESAVERMRKEAQNWYRHKLSKTPAYAVQRAGEISHLQSQISQLVRNDIYGDTKMRAHPQEQHPLDLKDVEQDFARFTRKWEKKSNKLLHDIEDATGSMTKHMANGQAVFEKPPQQIPSRNWSLTRKDVMEKVKLPLRIEELSRTMEKHKRRLSSLENIPQNANPYQANAFGIVNSSQPMPVLARNHSAPTKMPQLPLQNHNKSTKAIANNIRELIKAQQKNASNSMRSRWYDDV